MITIYGRIPSKKNSKIMVCFGKTPRLLPSSKYNQWHKDASKQLKGIKPIKNNKLILEFYFPDNRKTDLSNKTESIMDLLVDNGIIEVDNFFIVPSLKLNACGIDKEYPRCEIQII